MILVDANLLLYAANQAAPEHEAAREWLDAQLSGTARVGLPWPSLLAFVRLASNPLVMRQPVPVARAWEQVQQWLTAGPAWVPQPTVRHAEVLGGLCEPSWMTSRLVPDAHLAALSIEHGLTLCSTDGDFARFKGVDWVNPLAPQR
ncbi:MAG: PIN domain-containing protein [Acidobacteria bacterium]|nr:PIN domain-containing protein [Acidobacteriota bacterium]MSO81810.1 PIN domain-containing protein [Acidobacteriota bacterium]